MTTTDATTQHILVAEKNEIDKMLLQGILSQNTYTIDFAATEMELTTHAKSKKYGLIVIGSIGANRVTLAAQMRSIYPKTPVAIIVSAGEKASDISDLGFSCIFKPYDAENLLCAIGKFISGSKPCSVCGSSINREEGISRVVGNETLFLKLLHQLADTLPNDIKAMEQCLTKNDMAGLASHTHSLKGASGNLAVTYVHAATSELEAAAKEDNLLNAQVAFAKLQTATQFFLTDLLAYSEKIN